MAERSGVRDRKTLWCISPRTRNFSSVSPCVFDIVVSGSTHWGQMEGNSQSVPERSYRDRVSPLWFEQFAHIVGKVINVVVPHFPRRLSRIMLVSAVSLTTIFNNSVPNTQKEPDGWGPPHSLILLAVQRRVQPHLWRNERKDGAERERRTEFDPASFSCYLENW